MTQKAVWPTNEQSHPVCPIPMGMYSSGIVSATVTGPLVGVAERLATLTKMSTVAPISSK